MVLTVAPVKIVKKITGNEAYRGTWHESWKLQPRHLKDLEGFDATARKRGRRGRAGRRRWIWVLEGSDPSGIQTGNGYRKANVWRRLRNEDGTVVLAEENPDVEW